MGKAGKRNKPRRHAQALAVLALLFPAMVIGAADIRVLLRNGDRLTGQVLAEDARQLTLSNAVLGRILVPLAEITRRENAPAEASPPGAMITAAPRTSPPPSQYPAKSLDELLADYRSGKLSAAEYHARRLEAMAGAGSVPALVVSSHPQPSPAPAPSPAPPVKPTRIISGEIQAGADLGYGTKDRSLYTGRFKLNYSQAGFSNQVDYLFTYGQTEDEVSANRMFGSVKTDYRLYSRLYAYNLFTGGYDEIRKIDHSFNVGPGLGNHFLTRKDVVFNAEAGLNYQIQQDSIGGDMNSLYYRVAQAFRWLLSPRVSFEEKLDVISKYDNLDTYKLRFEAGAKYALNAHLSLNLGIINIYDTNPAPGVDPNDLQIVSTIGVRF